jgi:ammonia channel protein AmtB
LRVLAELTSLALFGLFVIGILAGFVAGVVGVVERRGLVNSILAILLSIVAALAVLLPLTRPLD